MDPFASATPGHFQCRSGNEGIEPVGLVSWSTAHHIMNITIYITARRSGNLYPERFPSPRASLQDIRNNIPNLLLLHTQIE
jgi:hypothetical protein